MAKKHVVALATVGVVVALFVVCLVSAVQLLAPRDMPFGVTGPSPVVQAVQKKYSLDITKYSSAADLKQAAEDGDIYGGYIPGSSSDTLVTVPAKSFFGEIYVRGGFTAAAEKLDRPLTTDVIAPLPTSDRTGALVGLCCSRRSSAPTWLPRCSTRSARQAAVRGRIPIVLAFSIVVALITGIAAGPILGAFPTSHLWSLLPCFALVAAAVGLAAVALQGLLGKLGTLVVAVFFIVLGGASAGGTGVALLPTYWQHIGALFPPRYAIDLYRNVRYFDGHNITTAIAVLTAYAYRLGPSSSCWSERRNQRADPRDRRCSRTQRCAPQLAPRRIVPKDPRRPRCAGAHPHRTVLSDLHEFRTLSRRQRHAVRCPWGRPSLAKAAQGDLFSLDITKYPNQGAATDAMDQGKIYGALIAGGSSNQSDRGLVDQ